MLFVSSRAALIICLVCLEHALAFSRGLNGESRGTNDGCMVPNREICLLLTRKERSDYKTRLVVGVIETSRLTI